MPFILRGPSCRKIILKRHKLLGIKTDKLCKINSAKVKIKKASLTKTVVDAFFC